ncbi:MAG: TrbI/VirB10 family protein [Hyphomonadaceae bacterium]|nr:TrbI/VirB10 family protein [Hyphomonadaceae bacterium]
MTDAAQADAGQPPPNLSIRARPPSPRRLSRKVLLTGAIIAGGVIALALFFGLSERPDRAVRQADAQAAAGGPPESIRNASAQYQAGDLPNAELTEPRDMLWGDHQPPDDAALQPPQDAAWSGGPTQRNAAQLATTPPPDPQAVARTSALLFGTERAQGEARAVADDDRLDARLQAPRSRFELIAGSVIPAALVTELNSDVPGRAIAQVTANVFDTVSGEHLLIPQGSRLMGTYESETNYGDRRLVLRWDRLIFPNGWSISLRSMDGADPSGAAGLHDRVDNHLGQLTGAIALSAVMSVVADNAEDDDENSLSQSVGDAAASEAARTGSRIVERDLNVRPTLRIRAGGAVRVLVTRDIQLRPYRPR